MFKDLLFIGRTIVGWLAAWLLYWLGHALSFSFRVDWHHIKIVYPVYNWLMCKSSDVQDWGRAEGPWKE